MGDEVPKTDQGNTFVSDLLNWILNCCKESIKINQVYKQDQEIRYVIVSSGDLVAKLCLTLATPWTVAIQAPLSKGFSRQEYWSGSPFPSPRDLSNPGIEPRSPALQEDSLPTETWLLHMPLKPTRGDFKLRVRELTVWNSEESFSLER